MESELAEHGPHPGDAESALPFLTIVTTLLYPRKRPMECLRSWIQQRGYSDGQIELIVVINGRRKRWETRVVSEVLRPHDRTVFFEGNNEMALYDAGIREARGEWILMTEPHVIAEPDCIIELIDFVRSHDLEGACTRTIPSHDDSPVARMEERMYQETATDLDKTGEWRMITKRGVLFRKEAYLKVGGFDTEQLRFSETTLAAKLHRADLRMGFAGRARIRHQNSTTLWELLGYVWEYRRMELEVRNHQPDLLEIDHPEYDGDPSLEGSLARQTESRTKLLSVIDQLQKGRALDSGISRELKRFRRHLDGTPGVIRFFRALTLLKQFVQSWLEFHFAGKDDDLRYQAYCRMWQTFGDLSVASYRAGTVSPQIPATSAEEIGTIETINLGEANESNVAGFYGPEKMEGRVFRWSAPVAIIRFARLSNQEVPKRIKVETVPVRPLDPAEVIVFLGSHRYLPDMVENDVWIFSRNAPFQDKAPSHTESNLVILISPPWQPAQTGDPRKLGLPISRVSLE